MNMKVTLNVADDTEMRAHVKDLIRGMMVGVVREDSMAIIREVVEQKAANISLAPREMKQMVREAISNESLRVMAREAILDLKYDFIREAVTKRVDELAKGSLDRQIAIVVNERMSTAKLQLSLDSK